MPIIICPGIHSTQLTEQFIQATKSILQDHQYLILPTDQYISYFGVDVYQWLKQQLSPLETQPLTFIAFSAGVVGGFGAALAWQLKGGKVKSFIAGDGWGMPLVANFPIYRFSHDYFTHWSSAILGGGSKGFYADPKVEHLDLWRSPDNCYGWQVISLGCKTRCSVTRYLESILNF